MAFLVQQYVGDNGIQLGNEELVRGFSFGTNWSSIRIGIRLAINGYYALGGTDTRLGVCTGSQASYSLSTTDAVWWNFWATTQALTYLGTAPNTYVSQENSVSRAGSQRVSTTTTLFGSATFLREAISMNPTALRSCWLLDVVKGTVGAAAIGLTMWNKQSATGTGTVLTDMTRGDFMAAMEMPTPSNLSTLGLSTANLPTRFVKDWDSMFFAWPYSNPTVCVYDMAVVRYT